MSGGNGLVLLVEDNEDDVFLLGRALKETRIELAMEIVTNGQEALDYLAGEGKYGDRRRYPFPGLVLLDLKLPYLHGFEVLERVRRSPCAGLPVVVLTSSLEERDRVRAAELGVKAFLVKPPSGETMRQVLGDPGVWLVGDAGFEPATPAV